jgi:hypothetical protein
VLHLDGRWCRPRRLGLCPGEPGLAMPGVATPGPASGVVRPAPEHALGGPKANKVDLAFSARLNRILS